MFNHLPPLWQHLEIFFLATSAVSIIALMAGWFLKMDFLQQARSNLVSHGSNDRLTARARLR
jgi:hypothetical protein